MSQRSDQNKIIDWLNTLIVMAQWDKSLPLYFARLFDKPDQYQKALQLIRETPQEGRPPEAPGDALNREEWQRLYSVTTRAEALRRLFANDHDPLDGAHTDEISILADVSDLTTDAQTMFYSRNGTFHLVLSAIRQRPELNTVELITDGLNKFYTLLDTNEAVAEQLYKLAGSNDWYPVLASLYDGRDYTADESETAKASLQEWNRNLNTELRSILLRPTRLYRVPKKLIKLAWEQRNLFTEALNSIPVDKRLTGFELRQQVSNVAYSIFVKDAKREVEEIESDLQLLGVVARHYISVRKFAKLDGLVYAWPKIAGLAMANYANLEYVEDFFVEKKPRPTPEELDARDARELYELCEHNGAVIRFLRLRPYFKEIDEDELRRYRPLAPVTISDPTQPAPAPTIPLQSPSAVAAPVVQSVTTPSRTCRLVIKSKSKVPTGDIERADIEYEVSMFVADTITGKGDVTFSIRKLLDRILSAIGVASEESLGSVLKGLHSGPGSEQIFVRAGLQLFEVMITQAGLSENLKAAFSGDGPIRFVIASEFEELQYLPWEWFARPGEHLLSQPRFSLVRSGLVVSDRPLQLLSPPIRIMGIFPNSAVGARELSKSSIKALEVLDGDGARYQSLVREKASFANVAMEMGKFSPHVVHFEGYVSFSADLNPTVRILFSSPTTSTEPVSIMRFESLLLGNEVQLLVIGRNESSRLYGNAGPPLSYQMNRIAVPAVLAPIRAVDDVTATSFTTEFYRAFLAGNTLEQALYTARRKVASRGGDWTSFALFANPSVLDFFQPLPPTA